MFRIALLLLLTLTNFPAFAEDKQLTLADAKAQFAQAKREFDDAWTKTKQKLPETQFNELIGVQRHWDLMRDELAEIAAYDALPEKVKIAAGRIAAGLDGKPANPKAANAVINDTTAYFATATYLCRDRTNWLRGLAEGEEQPITGLWNDGSHGYVRIVEEKGRLLFDFNYDGGRDKVFGFAGIAEWNQNIGWFSDKVRDKEKTAKNGETNIAFIRRGLRLEIMIRNADYYRGKGPFSFDGSYYRAASIDAQIKAATVRAAESGKSAAWSSVLR